MSKKIPVEPIYTKTTGPYYGFKTVDRTTFENVVDLLVKVGCVQDITETGNNTAASIRTIDSSGRIQAVVHYDKPEPVFRVRSALM
jgi:hypothetical protein